MLRISEYCARGNIYITDISYTCIPPPLPSTDWHHLSLAEQQCAQCGAHTALWEKNRIFHYASPYAARARHAILEYEALWRGVTIYHHHAISSSSTTYDHTAPLYHQHHDISRKNAQPRATLHNEYEKDTSSSFIKMLRRSHHHHIIIISYQRRRASSMPFFLFTCPACCARIE